MEDYPIELKTVISDAVSRSIAGADNIGILFSGGLDSSLIAFLAKKHEENAQITLYTVGTPGSHDLSNVDWASKLLGLDSKKILIHGEDMILAIPKLAEIIDSHHPVKISFELPLFLALANVDEKLILSGQGADELFGGYARYLKMKKEELRKAMEKDIMDLIETDFKMDYKIAEHFDKVLKTPYLDGNMVRTAMQIPIEYKVNEGQRKIVLREVALRLGLPAELANKQKKASQYSSGILKELRKMAKKKGMGVNELIESLLQS